MLGQLITELRMPQPEETTAAQAPVAQLETLLRQVEQRLQHIKGLVGSQQEDAVLQLLHAELLPAR